MAMQIHICIISYRNSWELWWITKTWRDYDPLSLLIHLVSSIYVTYRSCKCVYHKATNIFYSQLIGVGVLSTMTCLIYAPQSLWEQRAVTTTHLRTRVWEILFSSTHVMSAACCPRVDIYVTSLFLVDQLSASLVCSSQKHAFWYQKQACEACGWSILIFVSWSLARFRFVWSCPTVIDWRRRPFTCCWGRFWDLCW